MTILDVKNLTKKYGDFTAVDNISFKAEQSELLGFLGVNGAGKSTTMLKLLRKIGYESWNFEEIWEIEESFCPVNLITNG